MGLRDFLSKQFIDVIQWTEPEDGILAWRFPMQDMEIQNGGKLTVRDSQLAVFVNEGKVAGRLRAGPAHAEHAEPPDSDQPDELGQEVRVAVQELTSISFSTRLQTNQRWGTATPITIRDREFGAVRLRAYGIFSYKLVDPRVFYTNVSGTRRFIAQRISTGSCGTRLSGRIADSFASSQVPFLDMAAQPGGAGGGRLPSFLQRVFGGLGLALDSFVVEEPVAAG